MDERDIHQQITATEAESSPGMKEKVKKVVLRFLGSQQQPSSVSLDLIAKVAGRLERMATESLAARRQRRTFGGE